MVLKVIKLDSYNLEYHTYIDVASIIAIDSIDSPQTLKKNINFTSKFKTFRVYFSSLQWWNIDVSCYDSVLKSWLLIKNKSRNDIALCNTIPQDSLLI